MAKELELTIIAGFLSCVTSFTMPAMSTGISTTVHSDRTFPPMSKSTPDDVTYMWSTTALGQTSETPTVSTPGKGTTVTQTVDPVLTYGGSSTHEPTSIEPVTPGLTTEKPIQMSSTILTSNPTGSPSPSSSESSVSLISSVTVYVTRLVSSPRTSSDPLIVSAPASTSSYVVVNSGQPETSPSAETTTPSTETSTGSSQSPVGSATVIVASAFAAATIIVGASVLVLVIVLWRKNRLPCDRSRKTNESHDAEKRQSYFPNHANPLFTLKSPIDQQPSQ